MPSLPNHRQLSTALLNSISSIVPQTAEPDPWSPPSASTRSTATTASSLQAIPESQRPLLLTLHVLFPSLLLPAFDLLDRGLVIRLCREKTNVSGGEDAGVDARVSSAHDTDGAEGIFLVSSIVTTMNRRGRSHPLPSQRYIVHLHVWNCSCPSFTVDTLPSPAGPTPKQEMAPESHQPNSKWSFGGLGSYGNSTGDVPCCKHLLACILAEKWPSILGRNVEIRNVTKDEMAGVVAEI